MLAMSNEVIIESINRVGVITYHRPRALNSLTNNMAQTAKDALQRMQRDKVCVIIKGKDNYSAGGDIKIVWTQEYRGPKPIYAYIYDISKSAIPTVAIMTRLAFGGGLATGIFCKYRVATENTEVSMPEVMVGMLPDCGGSYFLSRMKRNLGLYMGLTGTKLRGRDIYRSGLATHFVMYRNLKALEMELIECQTQEDINKILGKFAEEDNELPLSQEIEDIEYSFAGRSVEDILYRLQYVDNEWSSKTLEIMKSACPGSLKISFRSITTGRTSDIRTCLMMDYGLVVWSIHNHDFREGVRAKLVERDGKPRWNPKSLQYVTDKYINSFFRPVPAEWKLYLTPSMSRL